MKGMEGMKGKKRKQGAAYILVAMAAAAAAVETSAATKEGIKWTAAAKGKKERSKLGKHKHLRVK